MTTVKDMQQNLEKDAQQIWSELQGLAGEIRLKVHLASAEGRETWKKLEPRFLQFQRNLETAADSALHELCAAGQELRTGLERLRRELSQPRDTTPGDTPPSS